jgi:hypothetical protein
LPKVRAVEVGRGDLVRDLGSQYVMQRGRWQGGSRITSCLSS